MSLMCALFGHRIPKGPYHGDRHYYDVVLGTVDGINRQHASLYTTCGRCGTWYKVGNIHVPPIKDLIV